MPTVGKSIFGLLCCLACFSCEQKDSLNNLPELPSYWRNYNSLNNLPELPSHWRNYSGGGGDSRTGYFSSSELSRIIRYDIGFLAGTRADTVSPIIGPIAHYWFKKGEMYGSTFQYLLRDDSTLIVTFLEDGISFWGSPANFFIKVSNDTEIDYALELLIRYRYDLLAIEYYRGTDCYRLSGGSISPDDKVEYYECLSRAKPGNVSFLASLGHAYLSQIQRDLHQDRSEVDFKIVSKVDSVVNALDYTRVDTVVNYLGHTRYVREGADINLQKIEFITRHIHKTKGDDAAINYMNDQLSIYAADSFMVAKLKRRQEQILKRHVQK